MGQLKELLVEELQDLLHAEMQLTKALPEMADAAHNSKLKEAFEKHLEQTQEHVARLNEAFELLGVKAQPKPCKAMAGLIEEGKETIQEGEEKDELAADLALVVSAQRWSTTRSPAMAPLGHWRGRLMKEKSQLCSATRWATKRVRISS
jgi:manganese catalase